MLLRSFLIKSSLLTGFIILCLITSGITLAVMAPFHPGDFLFPIQDFTEQQVSIIYFDPVSLANYGLDLLERRINDISSIAGTNNELISLEYLDRALDQVTLAIS